MYYQTVNKLLYHSIQPSIEAKNRLDRLLLIRKVARTRKNRKDYQINENYNHSFLFLFGRVNSKRNIGMVRKFFIVKEFPASAVHQIMLCILRSLLGNFTANITVY